MEMRRILDEAVAEKYGKMPNEAISKRSKEEWHAIERSDLVLDIAAMYGIVHRKSRGVSYSCYRNTDPDRQSRPNPLGRRKADPRTQRADARCS